MILFLAVLTKGCLIAGVRKVIVTITQAGIDFYGEEQLKNDYSKIVLTYMFNYDCSNGAFVPISIHT